MNELNELRTGQSPDERKRSLLLAAPIRNHRTRGDGFIKVLDVASRSGHGGSYGREAEERGAEAGSCQWGAGGRNVGAFIHKDHRKGKVKFSPYQPTQRNGCLCPKLLPVCVCVCAFPISSFQDFLLRLSPPLSVPFRVESSSSSNPHTTFFFFFKRRLSLPQSDGCCCLLPAAAAVKGGGRVPGPAWLNENKAASPPPRYPFNSMSPSPRPPSRYPSPPSRRRHITT